MLLKVLLDCLANKVRFFLCKMRNSSSCLAYASTKVARIPTTVPVVANAITRSSIAAIAGFLLTHSNIRLAIPGLVHRSGSLRLHASRSSASAAAELYLSPGSTAIAFRTMASRSQSALSHIAITEGDSLRPVTVSWILAIASGVAPLGSSFESIQ